MVRDPDRSADSDSKKGLAADCIECPLDVLALLALYTSGGVIPDRGYFGLRHEETAARIGELDDAFVWEAKRGQVFTLGTQNWRILQITHNDVFVQPARPKASAPPFWCAEDADRDFFLSDKIARFLEDAQNRMAEQGFMDQLTSCYCMDSNGARFLSAGADRHLIVAAEMAPGIADALYAGRADIRWINLEGQQKRIRDISSSKDGNTVLIVGEITAQWMDSLIHEAALIWVGRDRQQVAFCHADVIDLMKNSDGASPEVLKQPANHRTG